MGSVCGSSLPPEHTLSDAHNDIVNESRTSTSSTASTEANETNKPPIRDKHDYEKILSSSGQLEIPPRFTKWFPPRHGHKNIRQLFKWHQQLGHGVTGSVHEIEYKSQTCAVKQIEKNDQWGRMLFTTEARVLSKLKHCGIIRFIDMFFDDKYYYLVLEKADFDLYYVMKQKGHLSERKTRNITYALLKAISYMHKKNLAHRDIKPENIVFISTDTNQPRLIDFGDAEMAKKDKIYTEFVGTPPYMSPERLNEHYGWQLKKADIWAIAVVAYEMYTGQRCFKGETQKQVFGRILRGEWSWPQSAIPSQTMQDFIDVCLSADPKDRPSANQALQHVWFQTKRSQEHESEAEQEEKHKPIMITDEDYNSTSHANCAKLQLGHDQFNVSQGIAIFENIASMVESNPLQDILVKGYVDAIKDDDLTPYQQQFDKLDADGDGFITGIDLVNTFTANGIGPNQAASLASIIISELDVERSGTISFRQFLEARMKCDLSGQIKARQVFDDIRAMSNSRLLGEKMRSKYGDAAKKQAEISKKIMSGFESEREVSEIIVDECGNGNGNGISREDIIVFSESQTDLKGDEKESLHKIFDTYDKDGDGRLTFAEFVQAVYSRRVASVMNSPDNNAETHINEDIQTHSRSTTSTDKTNDRPFELHMKSRVSNDMRTMQ